MHSVACDSSSTERHCYLFINWGGETFANKLLSGAGRNRLAALAEIAGTTRLQSAYFLNEEATADSMHILHLLVAWD